MPGLPHGYCPAQGGNTLPTSCPNGTYSPWTNQTNALVCKACSVGTFCPAFSDAPTLCPPGTYRATPMGQNLSYCLDCPLGYYCGEGLIVPGACHAGTNRVLPRGVHLSDCELCPAGAYSLAEGLGAPCPLCPADYFCQSPVVQQACPEHTTSPEGGWTKLNCTCDAGYECNFYRVIQATVTVNETVNNFVNNVNGVQTLFILTLASAAHVDPSQVVINGVLAHSGARRMLLAYSASYAPPRFDSGTHVVVSLAGAHDLEPLEDHLHGDLGVLGHWWEEIHHVQVGRAR